MALKRIFIPFILLFLNPSTAFSLSTDRDQPAEIEADEIEFDMPNGTRTYIGNVFVVQGTLRLKADKVIAYYKDKELESATAWGSLARFKQRPDGKEHDVEGWAEKIIVNQKQNTLTLIKQAALKQGPDTARGETIIYDMAKDKLTLKGGAKMGSAGADGTPMPERKMEDPFAGDGQDQGPVTKKPKKSEAIVNSETGEEGELSDEELELDSEETEAEVVDEENVAEPEPLKSGRSRLIIQPNKN